MKGIQKKSLQKHRRIISASSVFFIFVKALSNLTVNKTILRLKVKYSQEMREDTLGYMSPVEYRIANKGKSA